MNFKWAATAALLFSSAASAQVQISRITHRGTGCPQGTVAMTFTPDNQNFTIIYDEMQVKLEPQNPKKIDRKACRTSIDVSLGANQLLIDGADYSGFVALDDSNSYARYNSAFFFIEGVAVNKTARRMMYPSYNFSNGISQMLQGPITGQTFFWPARSPFLHATTCGGVNRLYINTAVDVQTNDQSGGSATVDSADGKIRQTYSIRVAPCEIKFKPFPRNEPLIQRMISVNPDDDGPEWVGPAPN